MINATETVFDLKSTGLGTGTHHFAPPTTTFLFDLLLKNVCVEHFFCIIRARAIIYKVDIVKTANE